MTEPEAITSQHAYCLWHCLVLVSRAIVQAKAEALAMIMQESDGSDEDDDEGSHPDGSDSGSDDEAE